MVIDDTLKRQIKNRTWRTFELHSPEEKMICRKQVISTNLHFSLY